MLTVKIDGTVDPLGLKLLRGSQMELLAPTRNWVEEIPGIDGDFDFGSELDTGRMELRCVSPSGLSKDDKSALRLDLVLKLDGLRDYDLLVWESDPGKGVYVRLDGRPEIEDHKHMVEVRIPLRYQPVWVATSEKSRVGSGTLANEGTVEAPMVITIQGPVTNPSVVVGGSTLTYTGSLASGDVLTIDTENMTVKFNGVNALAYYSGGFPRLQSGDTVVAAAAAGTTSITWRDRWI